ncbi:hypothetical protein HID58_006672 [Brassica napus]|uniref:Uncharacterized protein n=1 Tax=Brassica napus TaxID=3708 RepID=A0ABQ8EC17_BRANA|nr:hypothetical protein HID58_006672 [Brassica napus]
MAERIVKCLMKLDLDETYAYVHISNACYSWVFQEAVEQRTLDSQNINNKFNVKNYLNLVSGRRKGSIVT